MGQLRTCSRRKRLLAKAVGPSGAFRAIRVVERRRPFVRVLNFHSVPEAFADAFSQLLARLADRFEIGDPARLEQLVAAGPGSRSTLLLSFDDGLANHAEVAAELLEEHGMRALFALPVEFLDCPADGQLQWFRRRVYPAETELHRDEDVRAMTWAQAGALAARGHRICSHTSSHTAIDATTPRSVIQAEIVDSRAALEQRLPGVAVDGFCWPIRFDEGARLADEAVRDTYSWALCGGSRPLSRRHDPYRIYRTNVEVSWPADVIQLQLSGLTDLRFAAERWKRRRRP